MPVLQLYAVVPVPVYPEAHCTSQVAPEARDALAVQGELLPAMMLEPSEDGTVQGVSANMGGGLVLAIGCMHQMSVRTDI